MSTTLTGSDGPLAYILSSCFTANKKIYRQKHEVRCHFYFANNYMFAQIVQRL